MAYKIADAVVEVEGVGHHVTVFFVPGDKGIRGVTEAKCAARRSLRGHLCAGSDGALQAERLFVREEARNHEV